MLLMSYILFGSLFAISYIRTVTTDPGRVSKFSIDPQLQSASPNSKLGLLDGCVGTQ